MKDLIRVAPNTYLNKNDSLFIEKYLRYHPNDDQMVYAYAKEMLAKGKTEEAQRRFELAAQMGNEHAKRYLGKKENELQSKAVIPALIPAQRSKGLPLWALWGMFSLATLVLLLALNTLFHEYFDRQENKTIKHQAQTIVVEEDKLVDTAPVVKALTQYKAKHGEYPEQLHSLKEYLTVIPDGLTYLKTSNGYILNQKGETAMGELSPNSLVFYPDTRQLAIQENEKVLALYPVAFGKSTSELPEATVSKKVIDPNGGDGVFGTRGIVLAKNIAIHGTNDPSTIGKEITKGCLRMTNEQIENVYPYVTLGMTYRIQKGAPKTPLYGNALPEKAISNTDPTKEKTPGVTYHWRE